MERFIIELNNNDLKKSVFENAQFIFIAEFGAMGVPGEVLIITAGGSIFKYNYCMNDINKLFDFIPALKYFGKTGNVPVGWEAEYLGAGHILLISKEVYSKFKGLLGNVEYADDIGTVWFDAVWKVVEQQNKGKSPFMTKTHDELFLVMNRAVKNAKPMTEEECIEHDAEYGYDPDEDLEEAETYRDFVRRVQDSYRNEGNMKIKYAPCDVWLSGDQINLWTYWQGYQLEDIERGVDVLLVGQDWGNPVRQKNVVARIKQFQTDSREVNYSESTDPTDKMLVRLFTEIGYDITKENPGCRLFFTNFSLGYRAGSETGHMTKTLLLEDRKYFEELVSIIKPKNIICLGKLVYEAVSDKNVKGFVKQLSAGTPLTTTYPFDDRIKVFGVPHCGARGTNNVGGYEVMRRIWIEMSKQFQ